MKNLLINIRIVLVFLLLLLPITSGLCQEVGNDGNLYVYTKNAKDAAVYGFDEIKKITFSKNGIQIWNTNWPTEYSYSNIRVIALNSEGSSTAISPILDNNHDIIISYNAKENILNVYGNNTIIHFAVYNSNGLKVASESFSSQRYRLNTSNLPNGLYIVKVRSGGRSVAKKIVK